MKVELFVGQKDGSKCLSNCKNVESPRRATLLDVIEAQQNEESGWDITDDFSTGSIVTLSDGDYYVQWQQGCISPDEFSLVFTHLVTKKATTVW